MHRLLVLLMLLSFASAQAAETIRLTNGQWPPYLGVELPHKGIASRIVAEAFALEGIDVQWEFHPWARSLKMAADGQRDGSAIWLPSREREERFYISDPVIETHYQFFHLKEHPFDWHDVEDLRGLRIAATRGYDYGEAFRNAEAAGEVQISHVNSDEQGLRQLLAGRIDLFPLDKVVAFDLLYHRFASAEVQRLSFHPLPLRSDSLHLLLSRRVPGNAERMARFNHGLAQLRRSGKIARYLMQINQPLTLGP
ncbi:substrate-binding periplasmic protein [Pseudomonas sp. NCHU5208]|uniref:substrate-binding periplasmic protein n=1 Tax=unclassified Pseudomonas TaxID=196821 RepID=UPI003F9505FC